MAIETLHFENALAGSSITRTCQKQIMPDN
jgi:hypothetical protein